MQRSQKAEKKRQKETFERLLRAGQIKKLRQLVDAGDIEPKRIPEAIWHLANHKAVDLLDRWLAAGVDPNWRSSPVPLFLAASSGALPNVKRLLVAGADPNINANWTGGPLKKAVMQGHDEVSVCLLAAGADPTFKPGAEELAVLAAGQGMVRTLRALLDHGVKIETRGDFQPAFYCGRDKLARKTRLMARAIKTPLSPDEQAELDDLKAWNAARYEALAKPDPYRNATLLAIAHGQGHAEVVQWLLKRGADPSTKDQPLGPGEWETESTDESPDEEEAASPSDTWEDDDPEWSEDDLPDVPKLTAEESKRYDRLNVLVRLRKWAKRQGFQDAVERLQNLSGNYPDQWMNAGGASVHVDSRSEGGKLLRKSGFPAFRKAVAAPGFSLVMNDERAVLLPTSDPLDVLAAFGVSAPNVSIKLEDILATFRDFPIDLHHIRHDKILGYVNKVPKDRDTARELALRYLALYPVLAAEQKRTYSV